MKGKPLPMTCSTEQVEAFKRNCDVLPSGCWQYRCDLPALVYPYARINRRNWLIHRFMYTALVEPIPAGMQCCHTCDNCHCINPAHIFLGTHKDNAQDSLRKGRHYTSAKTHCTRGHAYAEHARVRKDGRRACRLCERAAMRIAHGWPEDLARDLPRQKTGNKWVGGIGVGTATRNGKSNKVKTHCVRGHEFAGDNLYFKPNGERQCRACRRAVVYERLMRRPLSGASGGPT